MNISHKWLINAMRVVCYLVNVDGRKEENMADQTTPAEKMIMNDLRIIASFDANINYSVPENIRTVLDVMDKKQLFSTVFGRRYRKRLQDMLNGDPYQPVCIFCGRENKDGLPLCAECNNAVTGIHTKKAEHTDQTIKIETKPEKNATVSEESPVRKRLFGATKHSDKKTRYRKIAVPVSAFLLVCVIVYFISDKKEEAGTAGVVTYHTGTVDADVATGERIQTDSSNPSGYVSPSTEPYDQPSDDFQVPAEELLSDEGDDLSLYNQYGYADPSAMEEDSENSEEETAFWVSRPRDLMQYFMGDFYSAEDYRCIYAETIDLGNTEEILVYRLESQNGEIAGYVDLYKKKDKGLKEGAMTAAIIMLYDHENADAICYRHQIRILEDAAGLMKIDTDTRLRLDKIVYGDWEACLLSENVLWERDKRIDEATGRTMVCYGLFDIRYFEEKAKLYESYANATEAPQNVVISSVADARKAVESFLDLTIPNGYHTYMTEERAMQSINFDMEVGEHISEYLEKNEDKILENSETYIRAYLIGVVEGRGNPNDLLKRNSPNTNYFYVAEDGRMIAYGSLFGTKDNNDYIRLK